MEDPLVVDVAVVGAGPAGAVAAILLARGGMRTALIDQAAPPRHKTCGGGILARVVPHLPCPIDGAIETSCLSAELADVAAGRAFRVTRAHPLVHMTMRADFDAALVAAARQAGAVLVAPSLVEDLRKANGCVRIATTTGAIEARWVIGADGASGIVARKAGWSENLSAVPAVEWEIDVPPEIHARHARVARFDFGVVPHGYAWVFPKRDHLTVGILARSERARGLRAILEQYLERRSIGPILTMKDHGSLIPGQPRPEGFSHGRVLLVGDAAGLVDPVLFEGITYAVMSANAAAAAILESGVEDAARVCERYDARLEEHVLPEIRAARKLAPLVYARERFRSFLFRRRGQKLSEVMADIVDGSRTYRSLLGRPSNYLKLLSG